MMLLQQLLCGAEVRLISRRVCLESFLKSAVQVLAAMDNTLHISAVHVLVTTFGTYCIHDSIGITRLCVFDNVTSTGW